MKLSFTVIAITIALAFSSAPAFAELKVGDSAPAFSAKTHAGKDFELKSRKGAGWTVLYFYPKAETPGCTKQACAFRDSIEKIRVLKTEVYGISSDTVEAQAGFHDHHQLTFDLIADPNHKVIDLYEAKMTVVGLAKRWTYIIDPQLKIRAIDKNVDPLLDADHVAATIAQLQKQK